MPYEKQSSTGAVCQAARYQPSNNRYPKWLPALFCFLLDTWHSLTAYKALLLLCCQLSDISQTSHDMFDTCIFIDHQWHRATLNRIKITGTAVLLIRTTLRNFLIKCVWCVFMVLCFCAHTGFSKVRTFYSKLCDNYSQSLPKHVGHDLCFHHRCLDTLLWTCEPRNPIWFGLMWCRPSAVFCYGVEPLFITNQQSNLFDQVSAETQQWHRS